MGLNNFKNTIKDFPSQLKKAVQVAGKTGFKQTPDKITVCGMGGSGLPASLVKMLNPKVQIKVHKNYPPEKFDAETAVICISYSGNTEETISCFKQAANNNKPVIAITTGGKLEKIAQEESAPLVQIPQTDIQPRWATGYLLGSLISVLENSNLLTGKKESLQNLAGIIEPQKFATTGKTLGQKTEGQIPLIYASKKNEAIAYFWKIAFNENVKTHAFYNVFPEANHNEIEGFEDINRPYRVLILEDQSEHPRIKRRMKVFKSLIEQQQLTVDTVTIKGRSRLEKIINSILIANWTVYHFAKSEKIDPEPVNFIERFKDLL